MTLREYYNSNINKNIIIRWFHYFDVYEKHFNSYVGKNVKILEIGVYHGGSLKMWKSYFGSGCQVIGVDIDEQCKALEEENIRIYIGDQADPEFLSNLIKSEGPFDIIIDDGGHRMDQQVTSFNILYPHVNDGGLYSCEDTHTSYFENFDGGYKKQNTFIELTKNLIDELNAYHSVTPELIVTDFTKTTSSIHIYDSIVIFNKESHPRPVNIFCGIRIFN